MSRTPQEERNLKLVLDMFDHVLIPFDADAADHYIAADYIQHANAPTPQLTAFLARRPEGGAVLELGTGNGRDAAAMLAAGFTVTPSDASPELAAQAEARLARPVRILAFDELDDVAIYDGVWACAALRCAARRICQRGR